MHHLVSQFPLKNSVFLWQILQILLKLILSVFSDHWNNQHHKALCFGTSKLVSSDRLRHSSSRVLGPCVPPRGEVVQQSGLVSEAAQACQVTEYSSPQEATAVTFGLSSSGAQAPLHEPVHQAATSKHSFKGWTVSLVSVRLGELVVSKSGKIGLVFILRLGVGWK